MTRRSSQGNRRTVNRSKSKNLHDRFLRQKDTPRGKQQSRKTERRKKEKERRFLLLFP